MRPGPMSRPGVPRFAGSVFAAAALLGACAPKPPPAPVPSPTAALDGAYSGTANGSCGQNQPARVEMHDGRFSASVGSGLTFEGSASPDGTMSATQPTDDGRVLNFTGRIDGRDLRGGSYNGRCAYAFALTREAS